jgi:DNA topoisomerase-3
LDLLTKGKTAVIKNFKSKAGKPFDAALKFDENYRVTFEFGEKKAVKGKK